MSIKSHIDEEFAKTVPTLTEPVRPIEVKVNNITQSKALKQLAECRRRQEGEVIYYFKDGTYQKTNINKEMFLNERGKMQDLSAVFKILKDNQIDLKAYRFEINI